ncbi:hypothetical protein [Streptomyces seoulensis]|uniref:hypothetical protein n=1 Tax=Streptomyces seoulensis TaxID=73044 RepID=UPI001FCCB378|nr:hypothetical protein [Streptomyces seoulensis]BDH07194.1 hypothetical protein HEK131_44210 [Streptomyces seoulensis]
MTDPISDEGQDVVGVLTAHVESYFGMELAQLKAAVVAAPTVNPGATDVVRWHGLLVEAQSVLDRAEDDLLAALETQPDEVDDPTLGLAHRVNAAVVVRDGRAQVLQWLLDPDAPGRKDLAAKRLTRSNGPAVQTSAPPRPASSLPSASPATGRVLR